MVIIPTVVQGKDAPASVIHSLDIAKQYGKADVIILARGGGSLEELWAFNNEGVVRAISACSVPVVSAIGHEVDFTLADFVADLRAPTPTAAAELVSPELVRVQVGISDSIRRMKQSLLNHVRDQALLLDDLRARLDHELIHLVQTKSQKLAVCVSKLNALNPLAVLKRGFGHIQGKDGVTIASISQVHVPSTVQVRLWDGSFQCEVTAKR